MVAQSEVEGLAARKDILLFIRIRFECFIGQVVNHAFLYVFSSPRDVGGLGTAIRGKLRSFVTLDDKGVGVGSNLD